MSFVRRELATVGNKRSLLVNSVISTRTGSKSFASTDFGAPIFQLSSFKRGFSGRKRPSVTVVPVKQSPKKPPLTVEGVSMKTVFPGTPQPEPIETSKPTTQQTTLDNGVIVATEETYEQSSTIGVFINAGSANETLTTNGTTHLLQRMGFKVRKLTAR